MPLAQHIQESQEKVASVTFPTQTVPGAARPRAGTEQSIPLCWEQLELPILDPWALEKWPTPLNNH